MFFFLAVECLMVVLICVNGLMVLLMMIYNGVSKVFDVFLMCFHDLFCSTGK